MTDNNVYDATFLQNLKPTTFTMIVDKVIATAKENNNKTKVRYLIKSINYDLYTIIPGSFDWSNLSYKKKKFIPITIEELSRILARQNVLNINDIIVQLKNKFSSDIRICCEYEFIKALHDIYADDSDDEEIIKRMIHQTSDTSFTDVSDNEKIKNILQSDMFNRIDIYITVSW
jgi:hypothetical protein